MALVVLILTLCSLVPLQSWDMTENDHFDIIERREHTRVKRKYKVQEQFDLDGVFTCDDMYKTERTPFVAIFLYKTSGRYLCLGSIIDHYHILSAKRCFEKADTPDILTLVGFYKAYWGKNSQVKTVDKIVRNEYMVALVKLNNPITYTKYVRPARFPASFTKTQMFSKAFPPPYEIVGFNVNRYDVPGEYVSKELTYEVKEDNLAEFENCSKNYSRLVLNPGKLFCTKGNATYCWGAWGGPVLKRMKDMYYLQVGLVVGDNCTVDTVGPFLAVRTDSFADWIKGNSYNEKSDF